MLGFFGALDMGARSLRTQRQGLEVAGQNLANVNNPAYARQRLLIQTSLPLSSAIGSQGTGVEAAAIQQIRNTLLDRQVQSEASVSGYLKSQQSAMESLQRGLGERFDSQVLDAAGTEATSTSISAGLNKFFGALQGLSASPTSPTSRQNVIAAAQQLAARFNAADSRIGNLTADLNSSVEADATKVDGLLTSIATLSRDIAAAEGVSGTVANDLRDTRQQKIEELSGLVNVETATDGAGELTLTVAGNLLVSGKDVVDRLEAYDAGGGRMMLRLQSNGAAVTPTSGSLQGTIDVRDGAVTGLRQDLNDLAREIMNAVNAVHRPGFNLDGGTGEDFFVGTDAATMKVNSVLVGNVRLIQASGAVGETGANQVALALAQLQNQAQAGLGQQTFTDSYAATLGELSHSLSDLNSRAADQELMQQYLETRRASISGVSIDEEMTDIVKYEKAFQASARLVATLSEMLDEVVNLKR